MSFRRFLAALMIVCATASISASQWLAKASLPAARWGGALVSNGEFLFYIGGGIDDMPVVEDEVFRYDPDLNTWSTLNPMPLGLGQIDAEHIDGKIYVPGGYRDIEDNTNTLFVYDVALDSWLTGAPVPHPAGLEGYATAVIQGKLYLLAGYDYENFVQENKIYEYDPPSNTWTLLGGTMDATGGWEVAAWAGDGRLFAAGGNNGGPTAATETYDWNTTAWIDAIVEDMPAERVASADAAFRTGAEDLRLMNIGGYASTPGLAEKTVFLYEVENDTWTTGASLPSEMVFAEADCLDGFIHVVGGSGAAQDAPHALHYALVTGGLCVDPDATTTTSTSPPTTTTTIPGDDDDFDDDDFDDDQTDDDAGEPDEDADDDGGGQFDDDVADDEPTLDSTGRDPQGCCGC
ncbi:hypothetical protein K8I61_05255 [bacterium]|nr:hypothetical protein [bacterium]